MEYLTTHDLVWINNSLTGKVNPYNYVTLEAAMAGQYSYGQSENVPLQAANLLERLLSTRPFLDGNIRTAFIAMLSFLNGNGYATCGEDPELASLVQAVATREKSALQAVEAIAAPASEPLASTLTLRRLIAHECNLHVDALKLLAAGD